VFWRADFNFSLVIIEIISKAITMVTRKRYKTRSYFPREFHLLRVIQPTLTYICTSDNNYRAQFILIAFGNKLQSTNRVEMVIIKRWLDFFFQFRYKVDRKNTWCSHEHTIIDNLLDSGEAMAFSYTFLKPINLIINLHSLRNGFEQIVWKSQLIKCWLAFLKGINTF